MTTLTIDQLKAKLAEETAATKARIAENKERMTLERQLVELQDEDLQNVKARRELLNESAIALETMMEAASKVVKEANLQTRTGKSIELNFYPTQRKHLVVNKLTGLMNSMVYTRDDVSKLAAEELGLTEIDVESYRNAMGRGDQFSPETGITKGFAGNAQAYNSNLNMLADKLGLFIPEVNFSQSDFDSYYAKSVERAELEQREAEEAEEQWNQDNGHGLQIDLT